MRTGRVTACYGRRGRVETQGGEERAYLAASRRHSAVCGDQIRFEVRADDSPALLRAILPRGNELARLAASGRTEVVAANFTLLAVVAAPEPAPDFELMDRLACAAAKAGVACLIIWNKEDLRREQPARLREYAAAGFEVCPISALTGERIERLKRRFASQVTVLAGQSGGGKSTLINALLEREAAASGALSQRARLGRHTTASAAMYSLSGGGRLIDLPGVRSLMPVIGGYSDLAAGFPEFAEYAAGCRFANCRHRSEPGCAVLDALNAGHLPPGRHRGYLALLREFEGLG